MKSIILIGGGGHCKSCIDVIEQEKKYKIAGVLDKHEFLGNSVLGYEVIGNDSDVSKLAKEGHEFLITLGQIKSVLLRKKIYSQLKNDMAKLATVISPRSYVSRHSVVGEGTIVMHDAMINASVSVGKNCIINSKALIEHDVVIESHCHISTATVINGGVTVCEGSFIGSNVVTREGVIIGADSFVKAGLVYKG